MFDSILHLGFPVWLRVTHLLNLFLMFILIRSGIQILLDFPRYYFSDDCTPGREWIKFTRVKIPKNRLWTSTVEARPVSPWLGMPGGLHALGVGRHWHFFAAAFWVLNGIVYIILLIATGNWARLIPISWSTFPDAWHAFMTYISFHKPPLSDFHPYDPLQQLAYAAVVFILAPLIILTGLAMSPAISGRFPWYQRIFGGRQSARSLHLIFFVLFCLFILVHVALVFAVYFPINMNHIVLGSDNPRYWPLSISVGMGVLVLVLFTIGALTIWSRNHPRKVQVWLGAVTDRLMRYGLFWMKSRQHYSRDKLSPYFWVNGYPPDIEEWRTLAERRFADWTLNVHGLVEQPLHLSLADLQAMPAETQVTLHCCIQGWTGYAEWTGVSLAHLLERCNPLPQAKYVIFYSYQYDEDGRQYYDSLELAEARYPQTILAYRMNGEPLPIIHGAPLRLRMETKLGFKMVKWIRDIELVDSYDAIGEGYGGYREDVQYYGAGAEI